jgi:hypothetical protein
MSFNTINSFPMCETLVGADHDLASRFSRLRSLTEENEKMRQQGPTAQPWKLAFVAFALAGNGGKFSRVLLRGMPHGDERGVWPDQ